MTFRGFIPRAEWGALDPRSRSTNIQPVGSLAHWMGTRVGHISHARCFDYVRRVQRFHMDRDTGRGWVDIAYSMLPCRHGYVFAGRGAGIRTAANGTNAANGAYHAIAVLVGEGDTVTADAIDGMWWAWDALGRGHIGDHRDVRSTDCPGPDIDRATNDPPSHTPTEGVPMSLSPAEEKTVKQIHASLQEVGSNGWFAGHAAQLVEALRTKQDGIEFADQLEEISEELDSNPFAFREMILHLRDHPDRVGLSERRAREIVIEEVVKALEASGGSVDLAAVADALRTAADQLTG